MNNKDKIFQSIPSGVELFKPDGIECSGYFLKIPKKMLKEGLLRNIKINCAVHMLALERYKQWWVRPCFAKSESDLPANIFYLLWEREDGKYGLILTLISGDLRTTLQGDAEGFTININNGIADKVTDNVLSIYAELGDDPYELSKSSIKTVSKYLKSFKTIDEKSIPEYVDYFGWCTWDAFYKEVDSRKIIGGLEKFKNNGIRTPLLVMDDGWLDVEDSMLKSFQPDKSKFPEGLSSFIEKVKSDYGVRTFCVWHTLQGYWRGIHPGGNIAKDFRLLKSFNPFIMMDGQNKEERYMIHTEDVDKFYHSWYSYLKSQGVDAVKVDNQASMEEFTEGVCGRVSSMKAYQKALQEAAVKYFSNNILSCMCDITDIAYNMEHSVVWRNSDDFFPNIEESHQFHVHTNAMNNIWSSNFALPDWDMFQSGHAMGEFHAAARAISGGPIYVSDKPDEHNFEIIKKLCTSDGKILRCDKPALPSRDCLFTNCLKEEKLLKITNRNGNIGVLGLFHCRQDKSKGKIRDSFSPRDVLGLDSRCENYAVYFNKLKKLLILDADSKEYINLPYMGFEILTISPIKNGIAPLGLVDKYNGSRAIVGFKDEGNDVFSYQLYDGGLVGLYLEAAPKKITVNGREVKYVYDEENRLLTFESKEKNMNTILVFLS